MTDGAAAVIAVTAMFVLAIFVVVIVNAVLITTVLRELRVEVQRRDKTGRRIAGPPLEHMQSIDEHARVVRDLDLDGLL